MLKRIILDPDALTEPVADSAILVARHRDVINMLVECGILMHRGPLANFVARINELPPAPRQLWHAVLPVLYTSEVNVALARTPIESISSANELVTEYANSIDILACASPKAATFGITGENCCQTHGSVEVVRFDVLRYSDAISASLNAVRQAITVGAARQNIWMQRLQALAENAQHITICDRYAGRTFATAGVLPGDLSGRGCGLAWVLKMLNDQCNNLQSLSFVTGVRSPAKPADIMKAVQQARDALHPLRLPAIDVTCVDDRAMAPLAHDRHIRFDRHAFAIGLGIPIFDTTVVRYNTTFHPMDHQSARSIYSQLIAHPSSTSHMIC